MTTLVDDAMATVINQNRNIQRVLRQPVTGISETLGTDAQQLLPRTYKLATHPTHDMTPSERITAAYLGSHPIALTTAVGELCWMNQILEKQRREAHAVWQQITKNPQEALDVFFTIISGMKVAERVLQEPPFCESTTSTTTTTMVDETMEESSTQET